MKKLESKTKLKLLIEAKFNIRVLLHRGILTPLLLVLLNLRCFGVANSSGTLICSRRASGLWSKVLFLQHNCHFRAMFLQQVLLYPSLRRGGGGGCLIGSRALDRAVPVLGGFGLQNHPCPWMALKEWYNTAKANWACLLLTSVFQLPLLLNLFPLLFWIPEGNTIAQLPLKCWTIWCGAIQFASVVWIRGYHFLSISWPLFSVRPLGLLDTSHDSLPSKKKKKSIILWLFVPSLTPQQAGDIPFLLLTTILVSLNMYSQ